MLSSTAALLERICRRSLRLFEVLHGGPGRAHAVQRRRGPCRTVSGVSVCRRSGGATSVNLSWDGALQVGGVHINHINRFLHFGERGLIGSRWCRAGSRARAGRACVASLAVAGGGDVGLVARGIRHAAVLAVEHPQLGAAEKFERAHMAAYSVRRLVAPDGREVGVVGRLQHGDEDLGTADFAGGPVGDVGGGPRAFAIASGVRAESAPVGILEKIL